KLNLLGGPFLTEGYEYLVEPLRSTARRVCEKKATQGGRTHVNIIRALHRCKYNTYKQGVLYLFPTRGDVTDFSNSRFKPMISENPKEISAYIKDTDQANLKRIGNAFLYFRGARMATKTEAGAKDAHQLKSIPVDECIFDEFDEMPAKAEELALSRMENSPWKNETYLANPTIPDWGIDRKYCVVPETKILTDKLKWIEAKSLKVNDLVIGFDEHRPQERKIRKYHTTRVNNVDRIKLPCRKIVMEDGTSVICSMQHQWLCESGTNLRWRLTKNLKIGERILSIGTWDTITTYDAGWLAGMFDGEGSVSVQKLQSGGYGRNLSISQNQTKVLVKIKTLLNQYGVKYNEHISESGCSALDINGGLPSMLKLLGSIRPIRLLEKASVLWENRAVGNDMGCTKKIKILKIEDVGVQEVITLGTDHKTFIAEGLLSHNSDSDQRVWMIKCDKCGRYTCLELEFPNCLERLSNGKVIRLCAKCRDREIYPRNGRWVPQYPSKTKDMVGYWASHLMSIRTDMTEMLNTYEDPRTDVTLFHNLKLGMGYIAAEDRLTVNEVLSRCSTDVMDVRHDGPCAMGVDVGSDLHVTIGTVPYPGGLKVRKMARVSNFTDVHDLAKRFGVVSAVFDLYPETRKVREFRAAASFEVFGCDYQETQKGAFAWNEQNGVVTVNRTEICDATHNLVATKNLQDSGVATGNIELPREDEEVRIYARQMCNTAKVLIEDEETGKKTYRYRGKLGGPDDYRHSTNYLFLACERIRPVVNVVVPATVPKADYKYD
ncbi:MAG: phage terminase large subunit family protein, partial [Desulfobacteraceae bacterium]|nr:phage terminase large subunit family protein [Desulfobacteraceae bacterium]